MGRHVVLGGYEAQPCRFFSMAIPEEGSGKIPLAIEMGTDHIQVDLPS